MPNNVIDQYVINAELGRAAFEELQAEYLAIPKEALINVNFDGVNAAYVAFGAAPEVAKLRERIAVEAPLFPLELVDKLTKYACGAWWACAIGVAGETRPADYDKLFTRGLQLREKFKVAAPALVFDGRLEEARIKEIGEGTGEADAVNDVAAYATQYDRHWAEVEGRSIVTREDVDEAIRVAGLMFAYRAMKLHGAGDATVDAEMRQRALTALDGAYSKIRRLVQFIVGDAAELIVPTHRPQGTRRVADKPADRIVPTSEPARPAAPPSTGSPIGDGSDPFKK